MSITWIREILGWVRQPKHRPMTSLRKSRAYQPTFLDLERRETPTATLNPSDTTPVVTVGKGFDGVHYGESGATFATANASVAVGPSAVLEAVNGSARIMDKAGTPVSTIDLATLFPKATSSAILFDPVAVYDDNSQRFFLVALEQDNTALTSFLHIAASNTSTPTNLITDFSEKQTIDLVQTSATNGLLWGDSPRVGYNADGLFVSVNMFGFATGSPDRATIFTFQKSTLLDNNAATLRFYPSNRSLQDFATVPAQMHAAPAGGPMLFINTNGENGVGIYNNGQLRVTRMTNYFGTTPAFGASLVMVPNFNSGLIPDATQPYTSVTANGFRVGDTRVTSAAWRNGHLVATQQVNVGGVSNVRWYEMDVPTTSAPPSLLNYNTIPAAGGVSDFFPAIDIGANLDIGLTYTQTSANEYLSIYAAGRAASDPKNGMRPSVLIKSGNAVLPAPASSGVVNQSNSDAIANPVVSPGGATAAYRTSGTSGIAIDPIVPNKFWIVGEYANDAAGSQKWSTYIAGFNVSPLMNNPVTVLSPTRWTYDRGTDTYVGNIVINNTSPTITGTLTLTFTLPDQSVQLVSPNATRKGNVVNLNVNGPFVQNQPVKVPLRVTDPFKIPLGTGQVGLLGGIG